MSSSTPTKPRPLSFMTRLTPHIYLYTPDPSETPSAPARKTSPPPPDLILFASWMGADDKHIAKYLTRYRTLYPTSHILLIKTDPKEIIIPSWGRQAVRPAVPVIRSIVPPSSSPNPNPRLLAHVFSNAGSWVLSHLYSAFAETARPGTEDDTLLPLHSTVFDSTPGERTYRGSIVAFGATVPKGWRRTLALPLVHLLVLSFWAWYVVSGRDGLAWYAERHNDKSLVREVRRSYCYSEEDLPIPWRGIERHAARARERGFEARLEKFGGSLHVAHMVSDPERYWRIVRETWEGRE
ncbi:hypothetical protein BR93DRAFT_162340 [Coniochaeta sp. PMI_546]|nr:hypothetical protein BR93DRAFT_162340 [Coniochaeta sp. PMI_546]